MEQKLLYETKIILYKLLYLGKNKLDCIEMLISQAITDKVSDHNESQAIIDEIKDCNSQKT